MLTIDDNNIVEVMVAMEGSNWLPQQEQLIKLEADVDEMDAAWSEESSLMMAALMRLRNLYLIKIGDLDQEVFNDVPAAFIKGSKDNEYVLLNDGTMCILHNEHMSQCELDKAIKFGFRVLEDRSSRKEHITQEQLEENYPEAYEALPEPYKNDSCLRFWIVCGTELFAAPKEDQVPIMGAWEAIYDLFKDKWILAK